MRILVCGGRDYEDRHHVFAVLDGIHARTPITLLRHGACDRGADRWADEWARERRVAVSRHFAEWRARGRAAGPMRNQTMADFKDDLCVAFPGGTGTHDMMKRASKAGVPVRREERRPLADQARDHGIEFKGDWCARHREFTDSTKDVECWLCRDERGAE